MNVNFSDFEVVVIAQIGDVSTIKCFGKYSDYKRDKESYCTEWDNPPRVNFSVADDKLNLHE